MRCITAAGKYAIYYYQTKYAFDSTENVHVQGDLCEGVLRVCKNEKLTSGLTGSSIPTTAIHVNSDTMLSSSSQSGSVPSAAANQ